MYLLLSLFFNEMNCLFEIENYWIMAELSSNMKYQFRVRAHNRYGWSEFSDASEWFDLNKAAMLAEKELGAVFWIFTPLAVLTVSFLMMVFMCSKYYLCSVVTKCAMTH